MDKFPYVLPERLPYWDVNNSELLFQCRRCSMSDFYIYKNGNADDYLCLKCWDHKNTPAFTLQKILLELKEKLENIDKRLSVLEFSPPSDGGTEFKNILKEEKESGIINEN